MVVVCSTCVGGEGKHIPFYHAPLARAHISCSILFSMSSLFNFKSFVVICLFVFAMSIKFHQVEITDRAQITFNGQFYILFRGFVFGPPCPNPLLIFMAFWL